MTANNVVARLNAITKNDTATLLMQQIKRHCNFESGGVILDGRRWSYRSTEGWGEQIGASRKKTERMLKILRDANLVSTRMAWAGKGAWKRWVLHVAMTKRAEALFAGGEGVPQLCGYGSLNIEGGGPSNLGVPYIEPINLPINQPKTFPCGQSPTEPSAMGEKSINQDLAGENGDMKVHEMFEKKIHAEKANKLLHKPDATMSLAHLWQTEVNATTGAYVPTLSRRALRDLKNFRDKCPPGKAGLVLTWAIKNWAFFAKRVQVMHNEKSAPSQPTLGFLLRWVGPAVTMSEPMKAPEKHEAPKVISDLQVVQLTAIPAKVVHPLKQTLDEIYSDPDED